MAVNLGPIPQGAQNIVYNRLFKEDIDKILAELPNAIVIWEVARCIQRLPEQQQKSIIEAHPQHDQLCFGIQSSGVISSPIDVEGADPELLTLICTTEAELRTEQEKIDKPPPSAAANARGVIQRILARGQVRFGINVSLEDGRENFAQKMKPCKTGDSNSWQRTYGSDCFIRVRLSENVLREAGKGRKEKMGKKLWKLLNQPLILAQKHYRAAVLKEDTIWFFTSPQSPSPHLTLRDLVEKDMPIRLNAGMRISKFNARLQLSVSTTQPTISFKPWQIRRIPDIQSTSLMVSPAFMTRISRKLQLGYKPSIVEGAHKDPSASYTGQIHTWRMYMEPDMIGGNSIQMRESERTRAGGQTLTIEFRAMVYEKKKSEWEERKAVIVIPRREIQFVQMDTAPAVMTDGAAAISKFAAQKIKESVGMNILPSVFQARIMKAKGLWYLSIHDSMEENEESMWIEIRDSQWKANVSYDHDVDIPFNLVRASRPAKTGHVNRQSIPVLASRKVPVATFTDLLKLEFLKVFDSLTDLNHLMVSSYLDNNTEARNLEDVEDVSETLSRRPLSPMAECSALLKSGFNVRDPRVIDRLECSCKMILDGMINFKLTVPHSTSVYAMPDPTGTLKEGEVFLQLSHFVDQITSLPIQILRGECIVARSPCVHPCDARKVTAVANQNLVQYDDVLICSVLGERSLLDYLSGGDYDGDTVTVIWDEKFTKPFINANPVGECISPKELKEYEKYFKDNHISLTTGTVQDYVNLNLTKAGYEEVLRISQLETLFQPTDFGRYSQMHKVLEYLYGVSDPRTQKFGFVYIKCLDAAKQGISLSTKAHSMLKKEFESLPELGRYDMKVVIPLPHWTKMLSVGDRGERVWSESRKKIIYLPRKPRHVLEAFVIVAEEQKSELIQNLQTLSPHDVDQDLTKKWTDFRTRQIGGPGHKLLNFLGEVIQRSYSKYRHAFDSTPHGKTPNVTSALTIYWIEGSLQEAKKAVKGDEYCFKYLMASSLHSYCLLKVYHVSILS
ncbi:RNA dependent RNA polymerase-domain-containing protein [Melampsora americana]|nr:RNA dependent RNA polymerase-domain-containing protein [Melampsora americana]